MTLGEVHVVVTLKATYVELFQVWSEIYFGSFCTCVRPDLVCIKIVRFIS